LWKGKFECTREVKIRKAAFLAAEEACMAMILLIPGSENLKK